MKLKCTSTKLNFVVFDESKKPRKVRVGETFEIGAKEVPAKWQGLVAAVEDGGAKKAVTNPARA